MYYQYFGLTEAPFSIAVNPRYLFMSPRHRDALAHLLYGVGAGGGFILLTGEVGTGKTTINRCLLEQLPDQADVAVILNPALDARDLLATVCDELGITFEQPEPGLKELTDALHRYLLSNHAAGRKTVLMIDEAQHLSFDVLEQIRLLTNLETNEEKLLHIILIGQPELADKLARPELRQLNQRITARFDLQPLSIDETGAYIRHRLHVAGMPAGRELFSASLVRAVHRESGGVPRLINLLCDRMLLGAYGKNLSTLDRSLLQQAAREVLGEERGGAKKINRGLTVALVSAFVLVGAALFALLEAPSQTEANLEVPPSTVATAEATAQLATLSATPGQPQGESTPDAPAGGDPLPADGPAVPEWRLSFDASAQTLSLLYGDEFSASGDNPCARTGPDTTVRCIRGSDGTWNTLLNEGRPAVLRLIDDRRFERRAVFLGLEDDRALLASSAGVARVPLGELADEWTGEYWILWRAPRQLGRVLQLGDRGDDVRFLAELFASLDGQPEPLTDSRFDARLELRLKYFQENHGLEPDGVLGEDTLRALSLAVGIDLSAELAVARIEASIPAISLAREGV